MSRRFTLDGDTTLEQRLTKLCHRVSEETQHIVPSADLESLLLGGGYGRGEGGVLRTPNGEDPYNDLEFYVCLRGNPLLNERKFSKTFHHLSERLSAEVGIEVEFKISSLSKLRRESHTMFFYDLAWGHRVIIGDAQVLAGLESDPSSIPTFEATRLLMNRCSGLLFSSEKLQHDPFTAEDADFVGRNHAKAQLALGDVLLTAHDKYHWSCRERHHRLQTLASDFDALSQIRCHHALGMEFKLHPQKKSGEPRDFLPLQMELTQIARELWLWLESRRLRNHFDSIQDYALSKIDKCPETNPLRNYLINARRFRFALSTGGKTFRYPRERLLESLALLLWEPTTLQSPRLLQRVQTNLQTTTDNFPQLVSAYLNLWQRFN